MSWIQRAKVGDKVQCIATDDGQPEGLELIVTPEQPEIGNIYTIREICVGEVLREACIKVAEIGEQRIPFLLRGKFMTGTVMFSAKNFRPVPPISIFTDMLKTAPAPVEEDA